ncbi:MAG: hypothetical protein AAGC74_08100, partial [Verrucomicrobiota bacterium]
SSYRFPEVRAARLAQFSQTPNLASFHNNPTPDASHLSVRMNRPDAQTWSRSHLKISPSQLHWTYLEEFPNLQLEPKAWNYIYNWL